MRTSTLAFCFAILLPAPSLAEDLAPIQQAREIEIQGLEAYDNGKYEEAAEALGHAHALLKVPTNARNYARALVKLGKLVEAAEIYQQAAELSPTVVVTREPQDQTTQDANRKLQEDAKQDAIHERAALMLRISRVVPHIIGAGAHKVRIEIDGREVEGSRLTGERLVNPGRRKISGTFGDQVVRVDVTLVEGETRTVELAFRQSDPTPVPPVVAVAKLPTEPKAAPPLRSPPQPLAIESIHPSPTERVGDEPSDARAPSNRGAAARALGWVTFGLGLAGGGFGAVAGLVSIAQRKNLDKNGCNEHHCPVQMSKDVDEYNTTRKMAMYGLIGGGSGMFLGGILLLAAPSSGSQSSRVVVSPWMGVNGAGFHGRF
jgi:tetratricopeptide (TPR) repeat protein